MPKNKLWLSICVACLLAMILPTQAMATNEFGYMAVKY